MHRESGLAAARRHQSCVTQDSAVHIVRQPQHNVNHLARRQCAGQRHRNAHRAALHHNAVFVRVGERQVRSERRGVLNGDGGGLDVAAPVAGSCENDRFSRVIVRVRRDRDPAARRSTVRFPACDANRPLHQRKVVGRRAILTHGCDGNISSLTHRHALREVRRQFDGFAFLWVLRHRHDVDRFRGGVRLDDHVGGRAALGAGSPSGTRRRRTPLPHLEKLIGAVLIVRRRNRELR